MSIGLLAGLALGAAVALPPTFPEPKSLSDNVWFWEQVYARWRTDQVVIHDAEHMRVVYRVVDLGGLGRYPVPSDPKVQRARAKARFALVKGDLDAVEASLDRLQAAAGKGPIDPACLSPGDRAIYDAIAKGDALSDLSGAVDRMRWQYGLADEFEGGLVRYDAWRQVLEPVLAEEGVPDDLLALAFVESLFSPAARSHAGAAGLFQLMPATGRELGLTRTRAWDARRDPVRAARAAARMLRRSYRRLGSWPLALTAYNHGPNGVARAVEAVGSHRLEDLIEQYESPTWGFASKNFYAEFLAARHVLAHRAEAFGDWVVAPPVPRREVRLARPVSLSRLDAQGCVDADEVRKLNPALLSSVTEHGHPIPSGYPLRIPAAADGDAFATCAASAAVPVRPEDRILAVTRDYRVRRGETLTAIARRHGTTVAKLRRLNDLGPDGFIYAGQVLQLPGRGPGVPSSMPGRLMVAHPE